MGDIKKEIPKKRSMFYGVISLFILAINLLLHELHLITPLFFYILMSSVMFFICLCMYTNHKNLLTKESQYNYELIKNKGNFIKDIKNISSEQRHDYMNIFQIIYGYLQLRKNDMAVEHIKKITFITGNISKVYNLTIPSISLLLDKKIRKYSNEGLELVFGVKNELDVEYRDIENESFIVSKLNEIMDLIIERINLYDNLNSIEMEIIEKKDNLEIFIKSKLNLEIMKDLCQIYEKSYYIDENIKIVFNFNNTKILKPKGTVYSNIINNN